MSQISPSHYYHDLKFILGRLQTPEKLDNHPWARSLTVQRAVDACPSLAERSPGVQLTRALAELFRQMQPPTPPQDGKRIDTRWGRFGILAANYFAPLLYGRLYPRSLLEAWRRIDASIVLFVYGKPADELTPEQLEPYRLLGEEAAFPASSTISDWHRQGIQELADLFASREQCLSEAAPVASPLTTARTVPTWRQPRVRRLLVKLLLIVLASASVLALGLIGAHGYRIHQRLLAVKADIARVQSLQLGSLQPDALPQAGALLDDTDRDLRALRLEAAPWLGFAPRLGWVPVYGGDLVSATDLLDMSTGFVDAARQTYHTVTPIWDALHSASDLKASALTKMLLNTRPALLAAQATLGHAREARARIQPEHLSPQTQRLLDRLDPYISTLDQSLSLALAVPSLLGGTDSGPKTYLILVENEDELRPTGGFITAVGKVVIWNGQLISLTIADSYSIDDVDKAYPAAPWQLRDFMNLPIMTFHDTSWFTDYPTAVRWAEYLYAYSNSYSVDGVIAIDQSFMASLLTVTGPVDVPEIGATVTAENLRAVMRAQKIPPPLAQRDPDWYRKQFMNPIASAILQRMITGHGISWEALLRDVVAQLDERHMLVQLDDATLSNLLAERGWDGAVRREGGDFLMVVDTNVGYNKTNAVVSPAISYDVNLTNLAAPTSNLIVAHTNNSQGPGSNCEQYPPAADGTSPEMWYPIDRCYYDYLRVYVPAGTQYISGTPRPVTRDEMIMLAADIPARVDTLDEEIQNVQAYGMLLVTPMGKTTQTGFEFRLPASIIQPGAGAAEHIYHLKIQKQAGSPIIPLIVRVHLPAGASVETANQPFVQTGSDLLFRLNLRVDIQLEIQFKQ